MKVATQVSRKRGRIEIIPLIDIMFFLLAAFMMVSIHKIKVKSLKVSLPTDVPVAQLEPKEDFVSISINALGQVQLDKEILTDPNTLLPRLQGIYATNKNEKFLISADKDTRSGDMIAVLGKLRTAGFQRVAFNLKGGGASVLPPGTPGVPSSTPAPAAPSSAPGSTTPSPSTTPASATPAPPAAATSATAPLAPPATPETTPAASAPPASPEPAAASTPPATPAPPPEASPPAAPAKP